MKKIFLVLSLFVPLCAYASSGQWSRELVRASTDFAIQQEKEIFLADEVQIMDSYAEGTKTFITVGPEKSGRPARVYHCWITQYAPEVGDDTVMARARLSNKACRNL